MIGTFEQPQVTPMPPVNPEGDLNTYDAVEGAQRILDETFVEQAAQEVVTGAEGYLAQKPELPEAAEPAKPVEFNADMLRLFMLVKDQEARKVLAAAIAIDIVGQQNGIEELTFKHAAANRFAAERAAEQQMRSAAEDEDSEE